MNSIVVNFENYSHDMARMGFEIVLINGSITIEHNGNLYTMHSYTNIRPYFDWLILHCAVVKFDYFCRAEEIPDYVKERISSESMRAREKYYNNLYAAQITSGYFETIEPLEA